MSDQNSLEDTEDIKSNDISDLQQSSHHQVKQIQHDQQSSTLVEAYLRVILSMMQVAIPTPSAAPRGTSPKHGPIPVQPPMKGPNCGWRTQVGLSGDISQKTYPKYQVARQRTTTLPSMFWMALSLGLLLQSISISSSETILLFLDVVYMPIQQLIGYHHDPFLKNTKNFIISTVIIKPGHPYKRKQDEDNPNTARKSQLKEDTINQFFVEYLQPWFLFLQRTFYSCFIPGFSRVEQFLSFLRIYRLRIFSMVDFFCFIRNYNARISPLSRSLSSFRLVSSLCLDSFNYKNSFFSCFHASCETLVG